MKMCTVNNTLIPESDQHVISPFNITPESYIKVMGIKEMLRKRESRLTYQLFSISIQS